MDETCWEQVSSDQREVDETFDPQSSQNEYGEMAEWSKAAVLKTVRGLRPSRVRIPLSPRVQKCAPWAHILFAEREQRALRHVA